MSGRGGGGEVGPWARVKDIRQHAAMRMCLWADRGLQSRRVIGRIAPAMLRVHGVIA